jgi:hypothetical protein
MISERPFFCPLQRAVAPHIVRLISLASYCPPLIDPLQIAPLSVSILDLNQSLSHWLNYYCRSKTRINALSVGS